MCRQDPERHPPGQRSRHECATDPDGHVHRQYRYTGRRRPCRSRFSS